MNSVMLEKIRAIYFSLLCRSKLMVSLRSKRIIKKMGVSQEDNTPAPPPKKLSWAGISILHPPHDRALSPPDSQSDAPSIVHLHPQGKYDELFSHKKNPPAGPTKRRSFNYEPGTLFEEVDIAPRLPPECAENECKSMHEYVYRRKTRQWAESDRTLGQGSCHLLDAERGGKGKGARPGPPLPSGSDLPWDSWETDRTAHHPAPVRGGQGDLWWLERAVGLTNDQTPPPLKRPMGGTLFGGLLGGLLFGPWSLACL